MKPLNPIPEFISAPEHRAGKIDLSVNGKVKARFSSLGFARRVMNDLAVRLLEDYYPDYHFVLVLSQGEDTLDTVIL